MSPRETYIVVGVRADGSRSVMSTGLIFDDATFLKDALLTAGIFPDVLIELDAIEPDEEL
jgi:hypothetical protein